MTLKDVDFIKGAEGRDLSPHPASEVTSCPFGYHLDEQPASYEVFL